MDDSGYLRTLIETISVQCAVDSRLICLVGHSNGGFMSYRMACDHPDLIASIASLAGATHDDPADCGAASPVHTLQIHGTSDSTIRYNGGVIGGSAYPGAVETTEMWAANNECDVVADTTSPAIDLDAGIAGNETSVVTYRQACARGGSSELWTIAGGSHVPNLSADYAPSVIEWLLSHPKPCLADFTEDGLVNSQDVLAFLNAWVGENAAADCEADGLFNTADIVCFLGVWTDGC